jgi:DNA-binding response OmpR family regulator
VSTHLELLRKKTAGRRVLVVDDNEDAAESLGLLLRVIGHEVHVAHDGAGALAEAGAWTPEVVLLDIGLPGGMDGYQVARRLRAGHGGTLRLVALTGRCDTEDRRRGQDAGFDDYLVKPAAPEDIARILAAGP